MTTHLPLETGGMTAVEQFLDVIAHEVRTPLALARMAAETVATTELPPAERDRLLRMILRNTDLALLLLDRMGLARDVEADTVQLQLAETDVTALVRETIEDLQSLVLGTHPVRIDGLARCSVPADATALREILLNLLLNAAKYSPAESPIEVAIEGDAGEVTVVIGDHGCGVDVADLDRIFEQYVQVEAGGSGVGLGLYISRGLARAHGGELAVRRRGDDGSEFVLRLPRAGADGAGGEAQQQPVG
jgi:two-component system, OmpR family, phosphate regulon sensor histidine kinase PhoR